MTTLVSAPSRTSTPQLAHAYDSLPKHTLRKVVVYSETLVSERGVAPQTSIRKASAAAVITNPWSGTAVGGDLSGSQAQMAPYLAQILTARLIEALGAVDQVEAFGKGALVGTAGEIEHAGALIHTPYFGNLMRDHLAGESIICFADERGEAGQTLVVPMWHKLHASTRSHYQTISVNVSDAPRADEIVVIAAASTGPRPLPRIGDRSTDPVITADMYEPPHRTHQRDQEQP